MSTAAYRVAHREESAAQQRARYLAHREEISARNRADYLASPEKFAARNHANHAAHRERNAARSRAWRAVHRDQIPAWQSAYSHHTTPDRIAALFAYQEGLCAAGCGRPATEIDHDHDCCHGRVSCGKCIRGLLCPPCNRADALGVMV